MKTVTVRVPSEVRRTLQQLAGASHRSMQSVLAQAIEEYRRRRVLDGTNEAYARLRSRPDQWAEEEGERRAWEATLSDDLQAER